MFDDLIKKKKKYDIDPQWRVCPECHSYCVTYGRATFITGDPKRVWSGSCTECKHEWFLWYNVDTNKYTIDTIGSKNVRRLDNK